MMSGDKSAKVRKPREASLTFIQGIVFSQFGSMLELLGSGSPGLRG